MAAEIPNWARNERASDLGWIQENFAGFWDAAIKGLEETGRGLIIVDTTKQPIPGGGHPFGYFTQETIDDFDDEDTKRLVREYNPQQEFVVMLLKTHDRTSTYRVGQQRRRSRRK